VIDNLEDLFSQVNGIIIPKCHSKETQSRSKRSLNWERFNPLAYAGWITSRIFGYAHTFDLEGLNNHLGTIDQYIGTLKSTLNLVDQQLLSESKALKTFEGYFNEQIDKIQSNFIQLEHATSQLEHISILGFEHLAHLVVNLKKRKESRR
jgi:hypothetical protein